MRFFYFSKKLQSSLFSSQAKTQRLGSLYLFLLSDYSLLNLILTLWSQPQSYPHRHWEPSFEAEPFDRKIPLLVWWLLTGTVGLQKKKLSINLEYSSAHYYFFLYFYWKSVLTYYSTSFEMCFIDRKHWSYQSR